MKIQNLQVSEMELARIGRRVERDFMAANGDHQKRMEEYNRFLKFWNQLCDRAAVDGRSNFSVPVMEWTIHGKVAQIVSLILGPDSEIIAEPRGPSDVRRTRKIASYLQWRVFQAMRATKSLIVWVWLAMFFGRAFVFRTWRTAGGGEQSGPEESQWDGPELQALDPDNIILPADEAKNVQQASFVIRRFFPRPDDLLADEEEGLYFGIADSFEQIVNRATGQQTRTEDPGNLQQTRERAAGVANSGMGLHEALEVHEWYGRWRMLHPGEEDATETDFSRREMRETELVVTYIPLLKQVIGVRRLRDIYPKMERPRPFNEMSYSLDGTAWPKGLGSMLYNLQLSIDANEQLFDEAARLQAMPPVFYDATSGYDPDRDKIAPGAAIPCKNAAGVKQLDIKGNLEAIMARSEKILGFVQRLSRVTDPNMGLGSPNVQTASGQLALIEQSNVAVAMDCVFIREDMATFLSDIWELDCSFAGEEVFFRVTEEKADGLFDDKAGGSKLTSDERTGRYDFRLKLATSEWNKKVRKEEAIAEYNLAVANPVIQQNPGALWRALNKLMRTLGTGSATEYLPAPPDGDLPKQPSDEWVACLQNEDIHVHPMDNDQLHLIEHQQAVQMQNEAKNPDVDAINRMIAHMVEHQEAKARKEQQQAMMQALVQQGGLLDQVMGGAGGGAGMPGPMGAQPEPQPMDDPQEGAMLA